MEKLLERPAQFIQNLRKWLYSKGNRYPAIPNPDFDSSTTDFEALFIQAVFTGALFDVIVRHVSYSSPIPFFLSSHPKWTPKTRKSFVSLGRFLLQANVAACEFAKSNPTEFAVLARTINARTKADFGYEIRPKVNNFFACRQVTSMYALPEMVLKKHTRVILIRPESEAITLPVATLRRDEFIAQVLNQSSVLPNWLTYDESGLFLYSLDGKSQAWPDEFETDIALFCYSMNDAHTRMILELLTDNTNITVYCLK